MAGTTRSWTWSTPCRKTSTRSTSLPLVYLLGDPEEEIRDKAFGLIKHYLLNPTAEMRDDYYWSTLKNIVTAATVPLEREPDRPARPLTDAEIISLIRFRDIYYDDFREPVTGKTYLFIRISGHGIGTRAASVPTRSTCPFPARGALSTNMLFKTLGLGIPMYTIGKGGILGDLRLPGVASPGREKIRAAVLEAYADFLYYRSGIGPLSDVPAGDVGIGGEEIGIMYRRITDNAQRDLGRLDRGEIGPSSPEARLLWGEFRDRYRGRGNGPRPGRGPRRAGGLHRPRDNRKAGQPRSRAPERRGPGGAWSRCWRPSRITAITETRRSGPTSGSSTGALAEDEEFTRMARARIRMLTFSVQGFGKVGASFARLVDDIGAKIKMISDISGTLVNERGLPGVGELAELCKAGHLPAVGRAVRAPGRVRIRGPATRCGPSPRS